MAECQGTDSIPGLDTKDDAPSKLPPAYSTVKRTSPSTSEFYCLKYPDVSRETSSEYTPPLLNGFGSGF